METKVNLGIYELLQIFSEAVFVIGIDQKRIEWNKSPALDGSFTWIFHYTTRDKHYSVDVDDIECDNLARKAYLLVQDAKALLTLKLLEEVIY